MKIILCTDEKSGLMFNRRRQSQDRELRKRILSIIGEEKLYVSAYSAGQFTEPGWEDRLVLCEEPLAAAALSAGAYYFAEGQLLQPAAQAGVIEEVIRYNWNRIYPADTWLDLPLANAAEKATGAAQPAEEMTASASGAPQPANAASWRLHSREDFAGHSHEKITEEIYRPA